MKSPELSNFDFEMQHRKLYIKPRIERVSLVPEETVLAGCKNPDAPLGGGPLWAACMLNANDACSNNVAGLS